MGASAMAMPSRRSTNRPPRSSKVFAPTVLTLMSLTVISRYNR